MLKTIQQLRELLTDKNLEYLDIILGNLLDVKNPAFRMFWSSFKTAFPGRSEEAYKDAYVGINSLKKVLMNYTSRR